MMCFRRDQNLEEKPPKFMLFILEREHEAEDGWITSFTSG